MDPERENATKQIATAHLRTVTQKRVSRLGVKTAEPVVDPGEGGGPTRPPVFAGQKKRNDSTTMHASTALAYLINYKNGGWGILNLKKIYGEGKDRHSFVPLSPVTEILDLPLKIQAAMPDG